VKNRTDLSKFLKGVRMPAKYTRVAALLCVFLLTLVICHCSKTVDMIVPGDDTASVSAFGSCVACHTSAEMVEFTASPISAPSADAGEG